MCRRTKLRNFNVLVDTAELPDYKKELLKFRYLKILRDFQNRCRWYSSIFHNCRIMVSVGSLLVPALMSIQYSKNSLFSSIQSFEVPIYWATWAISLMVTIANGIYTLFKIDKRYYFLHSVYEKLQSEGYQYLSLTGKYSGRLNKTKRAPTHENQFIYFCHNIEKIKLSQVYEEFFKLSETNSSTPVQQQNEEKPSTSPQSQPLPLENLAQTMRRTSYEYMNQRHQDPSFNVNIYDEYNEAPIHMNKEFFFRRGNLQSNQERKFPEEDINLEIDRKKPLSPILEFKKSSSVIHSDDESDRTSVASS
jgi:hypothetical protein